MLNADVISRIAREYQTPVYIFDKTMLKRRISDIRGILGDDVTLCYAMKANPFLVDAFKSLDTKYEVCSPGEFSICEREHVDMNSIVLSGVNKEKHDICHVMDDCGGVGVYTAESLNQLILLNECAGERGNTIDVLLRVTSGNQFGIDEADIENIIRDRDNYPHVNIKGLQCYSGTQKKKTDIFAQELTWLVQLSDRLCEDYGCQLTEIEYGPGLAYNYFGEAAYDNNFDELSVLAGYLEPVKKKYHVTLEMGRFLVSECGIYVTSIADIKVNNNQNYIIVDGGINHINYYGQTMAMKIPAYSYVGCDGAVVKDREKCEIPEDNLEKWTMCGSLCTVADVVVKNLPIRKPQLGDMIIFYNIGAYSVTEGIYLFLSRKMPLITAVSYDDAAEALYDDVTVEVYRDVYNSDRINSRKEVI